MRKFKRIYIEITNICNLSCDFCPQTKRKPEFMKIEIFKRILNEIKPYGNHVYFHVKGEPLLHPELDKFLDICDEMGFRANITTNGTLIKKAGDKIINKPALRQINFSLHSFDGNEIKGSMEDYINDIISFTKETLRISDTKVALRFWNLTRDNHVNVKSQRNRRILDVIEREFELPYRIEEKISSERGVKIGEKLYLNQDHEFEWPGLECEEDDGRGFCYGLRNQIAILVDGTVVPCCLDGEGIINLGNINEMSFKEIINGKRARDLFEGFSRRQSVEELCKKCGFRKKFNLG